MQTVKIKALVGSPLFDETANGWRNGMIPSFAIAWSNLGAPVKLWRPAPKVDKNEPIKMTQWFGQAMLATTSFPPIDCPNLKKTFTIKIKENKSYNHENPIGK